MCLSARKELRVNFVFINSCITSIILHFNLFMIDFIFKSLEFCHSSEELDSSLDSITAEAALMPFFSFSTRSEFCL